jgi:hypothetical protein
MKRLSAFGSHCLASVITAFLAFPSNHLLCPRESQRKNAAPHSRHFPNLIPIREELRMRDAALREWMEASESSALILTCKSCKTPRPAPEKIARSTCANTWRNGGPMKKRQHLPPHHRQSHHARQHRRDSNRRQSMKHSHSRFSTITGRDWPVGLSSPRKWFMRGLKTAKALAGRK